MKSAVQLYGRAAKSDLPRGGCEHCRQSGYQGRAGIHEFLVVDSAMRRAIHEDKDEMSLETQLFKQAYSLRENGLLKVISGVTSLEEVMRVTAERGGCVMAFYARTATDAAGKTQRGTLQAEGQKQVRQWLREQKLIPVSITETREAAAGGKRKPGRSSPPRYCRCLPVSFRRWSTPRCRWRAR